MVQYQSETDRAFAALADPNRRRVLRHLADGSATITDLAGPAGMSITGMKKHVRILEEAGLVSTEKRGRSRHCSLDQTGFDEAGFWLEEFRRGWADRHERLDRIIKEKERERKEGRP